MRSLRPLLALGVVLSLGCGPLSRQTLLHDGIHRQVHVFVPEGAPPEAPLVLALHGGGGLGRKTDAYTRNGITREAEARGWVVAFPQGVERGWNDGRAPVTERDRRRSEVDDVGFLLALIDDLAAAGTVDPARVMMTGISNGGFMSYRVGVEAPERLTAIAPVIANHAEVLADRDPGRPLSVLVMNGTADPLVPYAGGEVTVFEQARGRILSTDDTISWWRDHAGCGPPRAERALPDRDPDDGTRVYVQRTVDCAGGAEVVRVRVQGGGHTWPGGSGILGERLVGPVSQDVDGARVIFRFFDRHVDDRVGDAD